MAPWPCAQTLPCRALPSSSWCWQGQPWQAPRALRAGLTPHVADRLDVLMAPVSDRQALIRLQNLLFSRAIRAANYVSAERSAVRRALLDAEDHRPWLDVASAREKQGALTGAFNALARARAVAGQDDRMHHIAEERLRLRLN